MGLCCLSSVLILYGTDQSLGPKAKGFICLTPTDLHLSLWEVRAGTEAEVMEECVVLFDDSISGGCSASLPIQPSPTCLGMAPPRVGWAFPCQPSIKPTSQDMTTGSSDLGGSSKATSPNEGCVKLVVETPASSGDFLWASGSARCARYVWGLCRSTRSHRHLSLLQSDQGSESEEGSCMATHKALGRLWT